MHRLTRPVLATLAAGLLLLGCGSTVASPSSADQSSVAAVLTATSGKITPVAALPSGGEVPTGHPLPKPSAAILGSPEAAFVAQLGQPAPGSVPGTIDRFGPAAGSSCDAYVVTFTGGHANSIVHHVCAGPVPDIDQRLTESLAFLPTDTVVGKAMQTAGGDEGTVNTSASLGKVLAPGAFQDCNKKALPPGTFTLVMTKDGWTIATGTCVTG